MQHTTPPQLHTETSYTRVTSAHLDMCFASNTYAPFLVSQAFYPLLYAAAANGAANECVVAFASATERSGTSWGAWPPQPQAAACSAGVPQCPSRKPHRQWFGWMVLIQSIQGCTQHAVQVPGN